MTTTTTIPSSCPEGCISGYSRLGSNCEDCIKGLSCEAYCGDGYGGICSQPWCKAGDGYRCGCCCKPRPTTTTVAPPATTISSPLLTAENLVDCINGNGGTLYTLGTGCLPCIGQKGVFEQETSAPVGPGLSEYDRVERKSSGSPTGIYPTWSWPAKNKNEMGCLSFTELNTLFECNLAPVSGHQYQSC